MYQPKPQSSKSMTFTVLPSISRLARRRSQWMRPKRSGALAVGGEPAADQRDGAGEELCLRGVDAHAVAPAAPVRALVAEAGLEVPGLAREPGGPLPLPGVGVHARGHLAQHLERFRRASSPMPGSDPVSQCDSTTLRGRGNLGWPIDWISSPSLPATGTGVSTTPAWRRSTSQASSDAIAVARVVAVAMDAQRPAAAVAAPRPCRSRSPTG